MTVIEVRGRGGQIIERVRCDQQQITIGRAFDNDVIVDDPYVSPHHLRLMLNQHGWEVEDLDSENGVRLKQKTDERENHLSSGDQLRIGHSELFVYENQHPAGKTLKIDDGEARLAVLGNHLLWPLLLALTCGVMLLTGFQHSFNEFKILPMLQPALWSLLGVALIASIWALIGRLVKHRTYFFSHLSIWFIFGLSLQFAEYCAQVIAYNAGSATLQNLLSKGLNLFLLVIAVGASITLATTLLSRKRFWTAVGAALLLMSMEIAGEVQWDRDFSSSPKYYAQLQSPGLLWVTPQDESVINAELADLLQQAVKEMEEGRKDQ